jgi:hypothetical protein
MQVEHGAALLQPLALYCVACDSSPYRRHLSPSPASRFLPSFHNQHQVRRSVSSLAAKNQQTLSSQRLDNPIRFLTEAWSPFEINGTLYPIILL